MTITREQLELAALAIGETIECTEAEFHGCEDPSTLYTGVMLRGVQVAWRPHTDIGDAARLALVLHMLVDVSPHDVRFLGAIKLPDMERAYCQAVTLRAAEIGRRIKEAK